MYANLVNDNESVVTEKDNIVIRKTTDTIRGGRTLDVTGYTPKMLRAGHVIIRETTGSKNYKPMPVNAENTAYANLPANHEYAGYLRATIPTKRPFAAIVVGGSINPVASPYPLTGIASDLKTALPLVTHYSD